MLVRGAGLRSSPLGDWSAPLGAAGLRPLIAGRPNGKRADFRRCWLIGSFFNIPIAELAPERAMSHHHVDFFGMRYAVPGVSHWKGTVVEVNVGGAVIPTLVSI